jgi:hypothetical protein
MLFALRIESWPDDLRAGTEGDLVSTLVYLAKHCLTFQYNICQIRSVVEVNTESAPGE